MKVSHKVEKNTAEINVFPSIELGIRGIGRLKKLKQNLK